MDLATIRRWLHPDFPFLLVLYVAAVAARLSIWQSPVYGDESYMFMTTRTLGGHFPNIHELAKPDSGSHLEGWFWERPMTHWPLWVGSQFGFEGWRLNHLLITSLTPVFACLILRDFGVRRLIAYPAAAIFVSHPFFVSYGTLVFHDGLGVVFVAAAFWNRIRGCHVWAAALFLCAAWVAEVYMFGLLFLLLWDLTRGLRDKTTSLWPLRLTKDQTAYAIAMVLAPVMLLYGLKKGAMFPGHGGPSGFLIMTERLFMIAWFAPVLVVGLLSPRTRLISAFGLFFPVWYIFYYQSDLAVQIWWLLTPSFFATIGVAAVLDDWLSRTRKKDRPWRAAAPVAVAVALALLVGVQLYAPSDSELKGRVTNPLTGHREWNLQQAIDYHEVRDQDLVNMLAQLTPKDRAAVFLVDLGWFYQFYPFSEHGETVRYGYSAYHDWFMQEVRPWPIVVENMTQVTIIWKNDSTMGQALRNVYGECQRYENASYVIIDGPNCKGRSDRFLEEFARLEKIHHGS